MSMATTSKVYKLSNDILILPVKLKNKYFV
jgi:hypothetical protein